MIDCFSLYNTQAGTFILLLDGEDSDEKAVTAMGILNTLETMLNAMEKSREVQYERNFTSLNHFFCRPRNWKLSCLNCLQIVYQLEQVVISLIAKVLELSVMGRILHMNLWMQDGLFYFSVKCFATYCFSNNHCSMNHSNYLYTCTFVCFSEFYEDILSIICTCTCFEISQSMWSVYYMLYEAFQRDAFDYFAGKKRLLIPFNFF